MQQVADPVDELGARLRMAVARIYSRFRSERSPGELPEAALLVLHRLRRQGPLNLRALSDGARVKPGSMSQTVNRLVAGGHLVRRPHDTDQRQVLFALSPSGETAIDRALGHREAWLYERLATLTAAERRTLGEAAVLLLRMADA